MRARPTHRIYKNKPIEQILQDYPSCQVHTWMRGDQRVHSVVDSGGIAQKLDCPVWAARRKASVQLYLHGELIAPEAACRTCVHELACLLDSSAGKFYQASQKVAAAIFEAEYRRKKR